MMDENPRKVTLEPLGPAACARVLAHHSLGRLAVIVDGWPEVFPVNYMVDDGEVVFRTAEGTKLDAIRAEPRVAFEVDQIDDARRAGWCVVVRGVATVITSARERQRLDHLLDAWPEGELDAWVAIRTVEATGRYLHVPRPPLRL